MAEMYFVGDLRDKTWVHNSPKYSGGAPSNATIKNFTAQYQNVPAEYSVIYRTSDTSIMSRIISGDEYGLVWDGDTITGIDFSTEDSKPWISVVADKAEVAVNKGDVVTFTGTVYLPDGVTVDSAFNGKVRVPAQTSTTSFNIVANFVNGVARATIQPMDYSHIDIPAGKISSGDMRIKNSVHVDCVYEA